MKIKAPNSGIVPNQSFEEYLADPSISHSDLKTFDVAPIKFAHNCWDQPVKKKKTEALDLGDIIHKFTLQPEVLERECLFLPEGTTLVHKAGKELKKQAEAEGKTLVRHKHAEIAAGVSRSLWDHPEYGPFFYCGGMAEVSVYAKARGMGCKGRADWLPESGGIMIDLKTTGRSANFHFARKQIEDMKYYRQMGFYQCLFRAAGFEIKKIMILYVETEPPYLMKMYELPGELLAYGADEALRTLEAIKQCRATNNWPSYGDGITPVHLPEIVPQRFYEMFGKDKMKLPAELIG